MPPRSEQHLPGNKYARQMTTSPSPQQPVPNHPPQPAPRPRTWPLIVLAITATTGVVLGATALTRPTNNGFTATSPTTETPSYTAAQAATAHQKLCDTYKLATRAVQIDTHGEDKALAAATMANSALMLEQAANAGPTLGTEERSAALALAQALTRTNSVGSFTHADDPEWQAAVRDVDARNTQMKALCGAS